jgi:hypothetical protein
MRKQTDIAGNTINLTPSYMMVPTDLGSDRIAVPVPDRFCAC